MTAAFKKDSCYLNVSVGCEISKLDHKKKDFRIFFFFLKNYINTVIAEIVCKLKKGEMFCLFKPCLLLNFAEAALQRCSYKKVF